MGAEYLEMTCSAPTFADGTLCQDVDKVVEIVRDRAKTLPFTAFDEMIEWYEWFSEVDTCDPALIAAMLELGVDPDSLDNSEDLPDNLVHARCVHILMADVKDVLRDNRHVSFNRKGLRWRMTTGGMSWGDSPNAAFDPLHRLASVGVLDAPLDANRFADPAGLLLARFVADKTLDVLISHLDADTAMKVRQVSTEIVATIGAELGSAIREELARYTTTIDTGA